MTEINKENVNTAFLTLLSMCRVLRPDGVLAVACTRKLTRKQLGNVSTFLLEAERVGVLTAVQGRPIRLGRSGTDVCDAIHFVATPRTGVQVEMIQRMPQCCLAQLAASEVRVASWLGRCALGFKSQSTVKPLRHARVPFRSAVASWYTRM